MKKNKIISFGKVDYLKNGKNTCEVEVVLSFDQTRFSACGRIWNHLKTDLYSGGQNLDDIKKLIPNNKLFNKIYDIWSKYHLNDLTAGSPKQMAFLDSITKPKNSEFYTWECEQLEKVDLLYDKSYLHDKKPYKYGSAWLLTEIPKNIKKEINNIMGEVKTS
jgi:hypothetical protein